MNSERIKFLETVKVKDRQGRVFEAGREYELPSSSARRWILRGKAEPVAPKNGNSEKTALKTEPLIETSTLSEPGPVLTSGADITAKTDGQPTVVKEDKPKAKPGRKPKAAAETPSGEKKE